PPRRLLALCSPRIQRTASTMFDFPDPFGPTMAVMPDAKSSCVLSAKLLKPTSSRRLSMQLSRKQFVAEFARIQQLRRAFVAEFARIQWLQRAEFWRIQLR